MTCTPKHVAGSKERRKDEKIQNCVMISQSLFSCYFQNSNVGNGLSDGFKNLRISILFKIMTTSAKAFSKNNLITYIRIHNLLHYQEVCHEIN